MTAGARPHDPIGLPTRPDDMADHRVAVWEQPLTLPTYHPDSPSVHPEFLGNRVYQGSSGAVYPMPLYESIVPEPVPHAWRAVHLENDWLRLVVLPELGGRIHIGYDRVRDHDFFHRQDVIKPALVGLAGPWIAGGVEFNWPQHHRPATYLPTEVEIEHDDDGSVTVWCSDHDPLTRMKGMHGIRLHPERAVIEVLARLHNRTDITQTFLWWANVAARVDEHYQSFFPNDVRFVADHANRATTGFPRADRPYYGVDYPARVTAGQPSADQPHPDQPSADQPSADQPSADQPSADQSSADQSSADQPSADRLDWYRNIPVPTSYMVLDTADEFFGGYDHRRRAGFVHWASREVSPGKKQWTWGNHEFGHAWDRALTDDGGHYIELMAGVYTNNQPDFTFLHPGETKTFSQLWYPIGEVGPVQQANPDAAASLVVENGRARLGVQATRRLPDCLLVLLVEGVEVEAWSLGDLEPSVPVLCESAALADDPAAPADGGLAGGVEARLVSAGRRVLTVRPVGSTTDDGTDPFTVPPPAVEPRAPELVESADELWFIGSHLEQYRHATRSPEAWWSEALRRDPGDHRCNTGMGLRRFRAADFDAAETHLRAAVARSNQLNLNPRDAEAHYLLGLTLARQGRTDEAWTILARAGWDGHWWAPAQVALARIELLTAATRGDVDGETDAMAALERLLTLVEAAPQHLEARNLAVVALRRLGHDGDADALVAGTLEIDPLDAWARVLAAGPEGRTAPDHPTLDTPTRDTPTLDPLTWLDVAKEFERCGQWRDALTALSHAAAAEPVEGMTGAEALIAHHRAFVFERAGEGPAAVCEGLDDARRADPRWALAIDHDDVAVLRWVAGADAENWIAPSLLGSWAAHWRRPDEAEAHWLRSWHLHPTAVVARCLGLLAHNHHHDLDAAWQWYERARELAPADAKVLVELDQLAQVRADDPSDRLTRLERHPDLVVLRHDLAARYAGLLVLTGAADEAIAAMQARQFQPWEGGEGQTLATWEAARIAAALDHPDEALAHLEAALRPPQSLGEARHLLANHAHLLLALGDAEQRAGRTAQARAAWGRAAASSGDFREMATTEYSDLTMFQALALQRLGEWGRADEVIAGLTRFTDTLAVTEATIDHFATSLPQLLLFVHHPNADRDDQVAVLRAQLELLAGVTDGPALAAARARVPHHLVLWLSARLAVDANDRL